MKCSVVSSPGTTGFREWEVLESVPSYEVHLLQKHYATREKGTLKQAGIAMKYKDSASAVCAHYTDTPHVSTLSAHMFHFSFIWS